MTLGEVLRQRERLLAVQYGVDHPPKGLDGEDLECDDLADAEHWVKVYTELADFTRSLLESASPGAPAGHPGSDRSSGDLTALMLAARVHELHLAYWVNRLNGLRMECDSDRSA